MDFIEELTWRGMIHNITPGTKEQLHKELTSAYLGIDPTADSLHIGHLAGVMLLKHLQRAGHRPIVLLGGATGMIGDPSGKSQERNLLSLEILRDNEKAIKKQLSALLDFDSDLENKAILVNNYDWMHSFSFLDFIRDVGKHITVNYMMAKDSVKKRLSGEADGMSFTEFTYQLVQGYDFLHLYKNYGCRLQLGGSDQWGNIVTGTELIRRKEGGEAFALTAPLITKADGTKFGKSESGNVWLSADYTSPYKFYQFWLNTSDEDAKSYIKIFTSLEQQEILDLITKHSEEPHLRALQIRLAEELTLFIHSKEALESAKKITNILFGNSTKESLLELDSKAIIEAFEGVPTFEIKRELFTQDLSVVDLLSVETAIFPSKGEARKMLTAGGVSFNKEKITLEIEISNELLIHNEFLIVQKGKKNYFLIRGV